MLLNMNCKNSMRSWRWIIHQSAWSWSITSSSMQKCQCLLTISYCILDDINQTYWTIFLLSNCWKIGCVFGKRMFGIFVWVWWNQIGGCWEKVNYLFIVYLNKRYFYNYGRCLFSGLYLLKYLSNHSWDNT